MRPLVGAGIGHTFEKNSNKPINLNINLMAYFLNFGHVNGTEFVAANDSVFDTLNYQFSAESLAFMVTPRLIFTSSSWQPFIFVGAGVASNRLSGYSEAPTDPSLTAAMIPNVFGNQNVISFAYQVGLGIQHQIYADAKRHIHYFMSMDYRYMNFGKAQLGTFPAETTNDHLQITQLVTQAAVLSLNASFG